MAQVSLMRMLVAVTLIAIGCAEVGFIYSTRNDAGPMNAALVIALISVLPTFGAGLMAPFKRPILGAFLGFLGFIAVFIWALAYGLNHGA